MSEALPNIYLAFWNLDVKDQPRVSTVRELLTINNLNPERAADVPAATALRRAVETFRSKVREAKCWTSTESGRVRAQIDELREEEGRLRRKFLSQYELNEAGAPKHLAGEVLDDLLPAFEMAESHYTGADLSKVIQAILSHDGLGTFSPRKGGGVYFVPVRPEAADLLARIEKFCTAVQVRFLTYTVPDTAAQRVEIANAIAESYLAEIAQHAECVAGYNLESKLGHIENRKEALEGTALAMSRLSRLMNGRYGELYHEIEGLLAKLARLTAEINTAGQQRTQANQIQGRRRIVPVAAQQPQTQGVS